MAPDARPAASNDELVRRLRERLEAEPDVVAAYLFGSHARGRPGPLSDVDVAVLLRANGSLARHLELIDAVASVVGFRRADVMILNRAPATLGYRVLSQGQLLFSRDEQARVRHWVRTVDRYLDMQPLRGVLAEGLRHRLEEGRFGRP